MPSLPGGIPLCIVLPLGLGTMPTLVPSPPSRNHQHRHSLTREALGASAGGHALTLCSSLLFKKGLTML